MLNLPPPTPYPGAVQLLQVGSVPIRVHWAILFGAALFFVWSRFDIEVAAVFWCAYLFLICLHEAGHALAAVSFGLHVRAINLDGSGGQCEFDLPTTYAAAIVTTAAGLIAQCLLLVVTLLALPTIDQANKPWLNYIAATFIYGNAILIVLNLWPIDPRHTSVATDGYVLLRLVWRALRKLPLSMPGAPGATAPYRRPALPPGFSGIEFLDDPATPMEFVVTQLIEQLQLPMADATRMVLMIHTSGGLMMPMPTKAHAESAARSIEEAARARGYPLICRAVTVELADV